MFTLHFDGLSKDYASDPRIPHAGILCYGWVAQKDGNIVGTGHGAYLRASGGDLSIAEYLGLIEGLSALQDFGLDKEEILISGDARSVIEQMNGTAMVSSPRIKALYRQAKKLSRPFTRMQFLWKPRRENHEADALTRRAMRQVKLNRRYPDSPETPISPRKKSGAQAWKKLTPLLNIFIAY